MPPTPTPPPRLYRAAESEALFLGSRLSPRNLREAGRRRIECLDSARLGNATTSQPGSTKGQALLKATAAAAAITCGAHLHKLMG